MNISRSKILRGAWYARDLESCGDCCRLHLLSIHEKVVNFRVYNHPHLLFVADETLERGPSTIALNSGDYQLVRAAAGRLSGAVFEKRRLSLKVDSSDLVITLAGGEEISFAPSGPFDGSTVLLRESARTCLKKLGTFRVDSASAVLAGSPGGEEYFRHRISRFFPALARSLRAENDQDFISACAELIGVGRGLSPTGDDLLHGAMVAHYHFSSGHHFLESVRPALWAAAEKTGWMGRHLLEMGRRGLTIEALALLAGALATGKCGNSRLHRLLKVGSSTGYDMAIGLLFYLAQVEHGFRRFTRAGAAISDTACVP